MKFGYIFLLLLDSSFSQRIYNSTEIKTEETVFVSSTPVSEIIIKVGCLSFLVNRICKSFQNVTEIDEEELASKKKDINMMGIRAPQDGTSLDIK